MPVPTGTRAVDFSDPFLSAVSPLHPFHNNLYLLIVCYFWIFAVLFMSMVTLYWFFCAFTKTGHLKIVENVMSSLKCSRARHESPEALHEHGMAQSDTNYRAGGNLLCTSPISKFVVMRHFCANFENVVYSMWCAITSPMSNLHFLRHMLPMIKGGKKHWWGGSS